jgi:hypothetical protein
MYATSVLVRDDDLCVLVFVGCDSSPLAAAQEAPSGNLETTEHVSPPLTGCALCVARDRSTCKN